MVEFMSTGLMLNLAIIITTYKSSSYIMSVLRGRIIFVLFTFLFSNKCTKNMFFIQKVIQDSSPGGRSHQ